MFEKPFSEMSLDEVFELEVEGSIHVGRSVVTATGVARHRRLAENGSGEPTSFVAQGSLKSSTAARRANRPRKIAKAKKGKAKRRAKARSR